MLQLDGVALGYRLSSFVLAFICVYYLAWACLLRLFVKSQVVVTRYNPPSGATPGVAAWLFERGRLPRAVAAALVNMAAKGYLRIDQTGDLHSVTQLGPDVSPLLTPEEDALARTLFKGYDCFDFDQSTPALENALRAFRLALTNRALFSRGLLLTAPAWIASGIGIASALFQAHYRFYLREYGLYAIILAFGALIAALRSLPGTFGKMAARLPGSTAPVRPWDASDSMNLTLTAVGLAGISFLAVASSVAAALLTAAFVAVNAVFFYAVQGPTIAGRKLMDDLAGYKKFLAEVDADVLSRTNTTETPPPQFTEKQAYALAFHLDLGWGEQFVDSIASLMESSQVFGEIVGFNSYGR